MRHNLPASLSCVVLVVSSVANAQTASPSPLRISGNSLPPQTISGNGLGLLLGSSTNFQWMQTYSGPLVLNGNRNRFGIGNLVGIGMTNPAWTLDVAGTIRGDSSIYNFAAPGIIGNSPSDAGVKGTGLNGVSGVGDSSGILGFSPSGFGVQGKSNVGIAVLGVSQAGTGVRGYGATYGVYGLSPKGVAGYFSGDVVVTGNFTRPSDIRYKTGVKAIANPLKTVQRLHGVTYDYNRSAFPDMSFPTTRQVGFVAQEVQSVLPQLVKKDPKGYLSVDYVQVVPVLVEAIKDQQKEIDALKAQVAQVTALSNRLAKFVDQSTKKQVPVMVVRSVGQ